MYISFSHQHLRLNTAKYDEKKMEPCHKSCSANVFIDGRQKATKAVSQMFTEISIKHPLTLHV